MPTSMHERPCHLKGIGQDRGNLKGGGGESEIYGGDRPPNTKTAR
jgi:hypothetical protein